MAGDHSRRNVSRNPENSQKSHLPYNTYQDTIFVVPLRWKDSFLAPQARAQQSVARIRIFVPHLRRFSFLKTLTQDSRPGLAHSAPTGAEKSATLCSCLSIAETSALLQPPGRGQHLVSLGADADVLSEIRPAHGARGIHQELCRAGNVTAFRAASFVQEVIAADGFSLRIRQDREGITGLAGQVARDFRRVNANGHGTHAGGFKLLQVFLDAS
jgi:hypothetical protein